jgi:predicted TPR repeat methyltransferase
MHSGIEASPAGLPSAVYAVAGTTLREVPLEEALSVVVVLQRQHRPEDAERVCRVLLELFPDHPDVQHFLALSVHQLGRHAEAEAVLESMLAHHPNQADAWSNLGIFRRSAGLIEQAASAFERAILIDPRHVNAWSNLGVSRRAQGRLQDAEEAYRRALELNPEHAGSWHNLGVLLHGRGQIEQAVVPYSHACAHYPANPHSRRMLAHAYWTIGENDKAVETVRAWLQEQPDDPVAIHLLAAYSGRDVPMRASDACIEYLFDSFAQTFDEKLRSLHYQAPEMVLSILKGRLGPPDHSLDIADAGCGTGLCGALLKPYARHLAGIDLSARMLERARARGVYDELAKTEIGSYFEDHPGCFDVITATDTLVYFGALRGILAAMTAALKVDGKFSFTLERTEAQSEQGYVLEAHGRYSHTRSYVTDELARLQMSVDIKDVELRMEAGRPVKGLLILATYRG